MANSSEVRSGLQIFLQRKTASRIKNTLFPVMPTAEFLLALNGSGDKDGANDLGRPRARVMVSGMGVSSVQREKMFAARVYEPLIQTSKPDIADEKAMTDYDNDPEVPNWENQSPLSRFQKPRCKFARRKMPYKVPHSDVRTAKANSLGGPEGAAAGAIRSVYDAEVKTRMAVHCQGWNQSLWGTDARFVNGIPTNEDATTWDTIHSLSAAFDDANVYCGVDRTVSANAYWQGHKIAAATPAVFGDIIDYCNYDLGIAAKGGGIQLIAVGATLFKKAKAEAKAESYQLMSDGIKEFPEYGFKREVVRIFSGNRPVYVYYDPECPAGHLAAMDPSTATLAVHPDGNFRVSTPADQTLVEGGDEADTGTINTELLLCWEVPSFNAYFTNVG